MNSYAETNNGLLLIANGYDPVLRWDGLFPAMEEVGLDAPTVKVTVAGTGDGPIVGSYYAFLRFVDRDGNYSNLSPISNEYIAEGSTGTITDATNATPIVITSASHGLFTGDTVKITGVGGNTSANDTFVITRLTSNTFSLDDSSGTAAYTGGGEWISGVDTITYTGVAVPQTSKVVRRQILRNTDGQAQTFYVDVDTTDLTGSTFSSTRTDSELSTQEAQALLDYDGSDLANRNGVPPSHKPFVASLLDRCFLAGYVDYTEGHVKVTFGSTAVSGVGTGWRESLAGRMLYVTGATKIYEIASVDEATQTLTLEEAYQDSTDSFGVYAIRPPEAERKTVYFSEPGKYESWPAFNGLTIQEDSDAITGLMARGPFIYILENRHIYKLTFQDDPLKDGGVFKSSDRGVINNNCWELVDQAAYMLDEQGVHRFMGGEGDDSVSDEIQDIFRPDSDSPRRINWRASRYFHSVHYRPQQTIRWFVALEGDFLPKHALTYNYALNRWSIDEYPVMIGASCSGFMNKIPKAFFGGEFKKVFAMWQGFTDIADSRDGTLRGTATSATLFSLTDTAALFPAVVNAPITIVDGKGKGQTRRIVSATTTTVTVRDPWLVSPDSTSVYQIGGVKWNYKSRWWRFAKNEASEPRRFEAVFQPARKPVTMDIRFRLDFASDAYEQALAMSSEQGNAVKSVAGESDFVADLTKSTGVIQKQMPGHREYFTDGQRFTQVEIGGVTNADPVRVYQLTYEGVMGGGGQQ